jgi:hypothetical protein
MADVYVCSHCKNQIAADAAWVAVPGNEPGKEIRAHEECQRKAGAGGAFVIGRRRGR